MSSEKYIVDIPMCVYNHERYIAKAIEGVLSQKTTFKYRLIIGEDYSTDNSREIVKKYFDTNRDKMKIFFNEKNIGAHKNTKMLFSNCRAKYIALCDGDDYWTDPYKLQKQVDFLESNPDFSICFHKAKVIYDEGIQPFYPDINKDTKEVTGMEDILKGNYMHTPTVVFRNNDLTLPEWFETAYPGDWVLHVINATYGKIKFIKEEMSVYRVHAGGANSMKSHSYRISQFLPTIKNVANYLKKSWPEYSKQLLRKYDV